METSSKKPGWLSLVVGSVGVVYGDIGTSPLYAFRESLAAAAHAGSLTNGMLLGVLSLILWTLLIIVTLKYVILVLRADNHGEGGILSLMALAQSAIGHKALLAYGGTILTLGIAGAALFYGDALITPAISVLSAAEGLELITTKFTPFLLPIVIAIITVLFMIQRYGTDKVGRFFGPVMLVWFAVLALGGVLHIRDNPTIWNAVNPLHAFLFLTRHGYVSFLTLGAVFLTVTGAEALYADLGHFGKRRIRIAWLYLVMPSLILNYFGQAALVMARPAAISNPFYLLYPDWAMLPMVLLAALATVIASQAVITGAFSLTHQAIQLGLLPRLEVRYTSGSHAGQIYIPTLNWLLLAGVVLLIITFRTSGSLASAYGIAVTGTMIITAMLIFIVMRHIWMWSLPVALAIITPLLIIDLTFLAANLTKILEGGYLPLTLSSVIIIMMLSWVRGTEEITRQSTNYLHTMDMLIHDLKRHLPTRVDGTAIYLTSNTAYAPTALLQNLKHNHVLHRKNILLTLSFDKKPYIDDAERVRIIPIDEDFTRIFLHFGYMEQTNLTRAMRLIHEQGVHLNMMETTFFISRRNIVPSRNYGMPLWRDRIFITMANSAIDPAISLHIPPSRVVELGVQMTV